MKATELMMGDWVMYNPNVFIEDEYESFKEWEKIRIQSGEDINLADENCYEPIPLTPEILEKNGGVKDYDVSSGYIVGNSIGLWFVNGEFEYANITVRYIHEFQHLLRLCGLNDLADNFKV